MLLGFIPKGSILQQGCRLSWSKMCERIGAIPAPPPTNTISASVSFAKNSPNGPEIGEVWRIGAGGAVTILSTPEGERDEMFTKLAGPMGVFRDAA